MTAEEIIRKIAQRSWKISMHSHGCAVHGRELPRGQWDWPDDIPERVYGPCDCGWADLSREINLYLEEEEVKKLETFIERIPDVAETRED